MPRVSYRPWTVYEEAVGYHGARRLAFVLMGIIGVNTTIMFVSMCRFSRSRHSPDIPLQERVEHNRMIEDKVDSLANAMRGMEERQSLVRRRYGPH